MHDGAGLPLKGRRILITRGEQQAGRLAKALEEVGAETASIAAIQIVPPDSYDPLDAALRSIQSYAWLVLTSANAARVIGDRLQVLGIHPQTIASTRIAAVGPSTAEAIREIGLPVTIVPEQFIAEGLMQELAGQVAGRRILLVRAKVARDVLPVELAQCGAEAEVVDAYQTVLPPSSAEQIASLFRARPPDVVTFTSSSTVKNFLALIHAAGVVLDGAKVQFASIGPVTSTTMRQLALEPSIEAEEHTIAGLVNAVVRLVGN